MYQGKNRTALASQRQIADALLSLMAELPYIEISVAALCRRAGVSRQTFYSLFRVKENVLVYLLREDCSAEPIPDPPEGETRLRQMCRMYARFVARHREVLRLLVDNDLIPMLERSFYQAIHQDDSYCADIQESYREYIAGFLAAGLTRLSDLFVQRDLSPAEMEEITYTLLRGECRKKTP